jgi:eukaryotic-like serine/threonine-protein kinase
LLAHGPAGFAFFYAIGMTNRVGRPDRTKLQGRWSGWAGPVWLLVLAVWLGSLLNVALNAAASNERYPGPLRLLQQYPWQAATLLTFILAVLTVRQHQHAATTRPAGGRLPGALMVRLEAAPTAAELASARRHLLNQVRRIWIEEVLDRDLAQVARIELHLAEQPGAVDHPWGALLHQPGQPEQALPPGTRIAAVAARFDGQLLILGGPGAGKTTLLLEYAADLLQRAEGKAAAPIPAVFHLSAWPAEHSLLERWLIDELVVRYGVARRLAAELIARDRLVVLLDGLDEVPGNKRTACVEAINAFRGEHGGVPLVVCARSHDYQELATRLVLRGALVVQPLDRGQVRGWLVVAGRPLAGLRAALRDRDHWLWGLLHSPLLLSIAALTYKGQAASVISADGSVETLLGAYVKEMLARPRAPLAGPQDQVAYADADTLRWLEWLAGRMGEQSVFYPDWIQPDWLPTRRHRWLATTGLGLAAALTLGLAVGLSLGLLFGLSGGLVGALYVGAAGGLLGGLLGGMGMGLTRHSARIKPIEPTRWSWSTARRGVTVGFTLSLALGLAFGLTVSLAGGLGLGLGAGFTFCLAVLATILLGRGFESRPNVRPAAALEGIRAAGRVGRSSGVFGGLVVVLFGGLGFGLVIGLTIRNLIVGLAIGLVSGLFAGLLGGLVVGLLDGGRSYLRHRVLVVLLRRQGLIPADLLGFLEYADSRILLRRAGGGYLFVHRLLQDYFANRADQTDPPRATMNP